MILIRPKQGNWDYWGELGKLEYIPFYEIAQRVIEQPPECEIGLIYPNGGDSHLQAWQWINEEVLKLMQSALEVNPEFNRPVYELARQIWTTGRRNFGIACDSALFQGMPDYARTYALPSDLAVQKHFRYGSDGLAHGWALQKWNEECTGLTRLITIHLCDHPTLTAFRAGLAVETCSGFSDLEGLTSTTTSGSIDPSLPIMLVKAGYSTQEVRTILCEKSGWQTRYGRNIHLSDLFNKHDPASITCREIFESQLKKELGSQMALLGGVDGLLFFGESLDGLEPWLKSFLSEITWYGIQPHDITMGTGAWQVYTKPESTITVAWSRFHFPECLDCFIREK